MGRRRGDREHGRSVFEFLALGVLAAVILGSLVATGLQGTFGGGARSVACRIVGAAHCDKAATGKPQAAKNDGEKDGKKPGKNNGGKKKKDDCHGVLGCAWHYAKEYAGGVYGHAKDDATGIKDHAVNTVTHPWRTATSTWAGLVAPWKNNFVRAYHRWKKGDHVKAAGLLFVENYTEPYVIVYHTIVDDGVRKDWHDGNYAGAAGGLVYNVVSWLIPGGEEAKGASAGSKIARGAEKGAGKEARAGEKAGKDAGKDAKKKPGDGRDKRRTSACGVPAAFPRPRGGVPAVRAAALADGGTLVRASPAAFGKASPCDRKIAGKTLSKSRLKHIWDRHVARNKFGNKSKFRTTNQSKLLDLIQKTIERGKPTVSADGRTVEYVYDTGRTVGTGATGKATGKVKVVVRNGQIITAYPVE
ncbi:MAG TPA: hypothetical protein VGL93_35970 [Streptosporangiaceae bacterium]|jgi:hypothetical protein